MRVAAIRYINALPLIYGLDQDPSIELTLDTPSSCYQKLLRREVDIALIPVIGTQIDPSIRAMKGLGIAATNRTESVILFSRKPLDHVESILADTASLTSVILLQILFKQKFERTPKLQSESVSNLHHAMKQYDAVLLIGDEAILAEKTDYDHYDLATEWYSLTGFPFVFAVWAANRSLTDGEKDLLRYAYVAASQNWQEIYDQAAKMLPVDLPFLKRYYNVDLHYQLTRTDYEGLLRFLVLAEELRYLKGIKKEIWM